MSNDDQLYCPSCGSSQLTADKKGFGAGKAVAGAVLTGGIGLLAGFIGSGKVKVTCLKCGSEWDAGDLRTTPPLTPEEREQLMEEVKNMPVDWGYVWANIISGVIVLTIIAIIAVKCM